MNYRREVQKFKKAFENWEPTFGPHSFMWDDEGYYDDEYFFSWNAPDACDIYFTITLKHDGTIDYNCETSSECKVFDKGDFDAVKAHIDDNMWNHDYR